MLNKGIATRTILLLVIGVLVLSVIIFLVYRTTTESTLSSNICMGKVIDWCTRCKLKGSAAWDFIGCADDDVTKCSCLDEGSNAWTQWVSKCVDSSKHWNFDPSAHIGSYEQLHEEYCKRVGVS